MLQLLNASGVIVDTANAFEPYENGWPAGDASTYGTMERTNPLGPDVAENWHTNLGVVTRGEDTNGRPLVATARALNSQALAEWTLYAEKLEPVSTVAGTRYAVEIELAEIDQQERGWPWIRVSLPAAGAGGVSADVSQYRFETHTAADATEVGIDTTGMAAGDHLVWVVFGESRAILVPIRILP
jgi:hypothetical protein